MTLLRVVAVTAVLAGLSPAARAADPAQSAMAGDPMWPRVGEVAPSITLQQARGMPEATEMDPTWPPDSPVASAGMALHQRLLTDDPLQGYAESGAMAWKEPAGETEHVACAGPCACKHG